MDEQSLRDARRIKRFRAKRKYERDERAPRIRDRRSSISTPPDHLSTIQLAAEVGLSSPHTITQMMKRGDIPPPGYERVVTTLNGLSKRTWRYWHISNLPDIQRAADQLKLKDPRAGTLFRSPPSATVPALESLEVKRVDDELDKAELDL